MDNLKEMSYGEAIYDGCYQEMKRDDSVFVYGLGVDDAKGHYGTSKDFHKVFGSKRSFDMPLSEDAMTGIGIGAALNGLRPIYVHQRMDFLLLCMNQLINMAAKLRYMSSGKHSVPFVVRAAIGRSWGQGAQHSQAFHSYFMHVPGIKVVAPSNPYDAKGLLVAAVNDPNPVMYLEHKKLYRKPDLKMEVPLGLYEIEIGKGKIVKEGSDITIVTWSGMVSVSEQAADELSKDGLSVEIVDIRTIVPLDEEIILNSVEKTSNLCIVQEDVPFSSIASEISSLVAEKGFWNLDNPIIKVTPPNTHIPFAPVLEDAFIPSVEKVVKAIKELQ